MDVIIQRGKVVQLQDLPEYSIAIDGFVSGPAIDIDHHRFSFDHHSGVYRFCTLSACMQVATALSAGLENVDQYTVYANDADSDVCLSVWALQNPDKIHDPLAQKLINAVGLLDMHTGAIPVNGMTRTVEWVSAPETDSKRNGDYEKLSDCGLYSVMEAVLHRIDLYVSGEAAGEIQKQQKHGEYKILRNENNWCLVESQDPHVYGALYQSGFDRVVITRPLPDGSNAISFAKRSDFIDNFSLEKIYAEINKIEPGAGGSSSCGGVVRNPDGSRSRLPLEKIIEIVDSCLV